MAFRFDRPIWSRCALGLAQAVALVVALPFADAAAQTKARPVENTPPEIAAGAPDDIQEAKNPAGSQAGSGETVPPRAAESPQERDRRLVLLRLLVVGGGSYRPFGFFR